MAEARIETFICSANRPYNAQNVADFLACEGFKKAQVQKGLDSLAESKRINCKEWGKSKIYCAIQNAQQLSKEEMHAKQEEETEQKAKLVEEQAVVLKLRSEVQAAQSSLSLADIETQLAALRPEVEAQEARLSGLKGGAHLVLPAERTKIQTDLKSNLEHWKKRRGIFRDIWDLMSENVTRKQSELFEELGIEEDEAGSTYNEIAALCVSSKKSRK